MFRKYYNWGWVGRIFVIHKSKDIFGLFLSKMAVDVGMWNVLVMGFAFMFMFTAFQTTTMIEVSAWPPSAFYNFSSA